MVRAASERPGADERLAKVPAEFQRSLELDPRARGLEASPQRLWATFRAMGLEPEDIDPASHANVARLSDKVSDKSRAEEIKQQRQKVWDGLRQSRMEGLRNAFVSLPIDDIHRYERVGEGIRMVQADDLPALEDSSEGMEDFNELLRRKQEKIQGEQQRRADILVTGFLREKKRLDEADEKIKAFERRLADKKKEQDNERKARKNEMIKKLERRDAQISKCRQELEERADETERALLARMERANNYRAQALSTESLKKKADESAAKRSTIFQNALDLESRRLAQIEHKQLLLEERLEEHKAQRDEETRQKREEKQAEFHKMKIRVYQAEETWVDEKLAAHSKFKEGVMAAQKRRRDLIQADTKKRGDDLRKAMEKSRLNYDKEIQQLGEGHEKVLTKHQSASGRLETLAPLRLKNSIDVHDHQEVKHGTWSELQKRRQRELTKSRDAHTQALVFEIAEFNRKVETQRAGNDEVNRRRQHMAKDILTLNDRAREGFQKIKCEPDEKKIHATMVNLGLQMPKLDDEEEQEQEEQPKKAF